MKNILQYHSRQFELIEGIGTYAITGDFQKPYTTQMPTNKKFASDEQRNHHGATAVSEFGPYGAWSQGEFNDLCGSLLD